MCRFVRRIQTGMASHAAALSAEAMWSRYNDASGGGGGSVSKIFTVGEPFALRFDVDSRCPMSRAQHYRFQADQAKRLARRVTDAEVRERLLEMAGAYGRYAELMEARERPHEQPLG
jgi:hypothetical protein